MHFVAVTKGREKVSVLWLIHNYLKDSAFTAVKWDAAFYASMLKGYQLVDPITTRHKKLRELGRPYEKNWNEKTSS